MTDEKIISGKTHLGIELGSTRIKACLIDDTYMPIAGGDYEWSSKFEDGYWTYSLEDVKKGLQGCYASLCRDVSEKYGVRLEKIGSIGISAMMHGYLAFDKDDNLLVPFRTWRNTTTKEASEKLSELFGFNIPQRWSISHLYQAILNREEHVSEIAHITTLSGYVHYLLSGKREIGACDASGMFPLSGDDYDRGMLEKFSSLLREESLSLNIREILPKIKSCKKSDTVLSREGASLLDPLGFLKEGIPLCPPEGDGGTGMVATNSVKPKTGNISAGTSVFSMLVLNKPLSGMYEEIDVVTTPDAAPVAMVHSNNGCSELDLWVNMFGDFAKLLGADTDKSTLYKLLYENALSGDSDCGEVVSYNFLADEPVAKVKGGKPSYFRTPQSRLTLANFFRSQLYAAVAVLKIGMDILTEKENVSALTFNAHGGLFKVKGVAQQLLANTLGTDIAVSENAPEGGSWGMALLAAYMMKNGGQSLGDWLEEKVFANVKREVLSPDNKALDGFDKYFSLYKNNL